MNGKTNSMLFGIGKMLSLLDGKKLEIHLDGELINPTTNCKYLVIYNNLDNLLLHLLHFDKTCKKTASRINMMKRLRSSLTPAVAEAFYKMLLLPQNSSIYSVVLRLFTYCDTLSLGLPDSRLKISVA